MVDFDEMSGKAPEWYEAINKVIGLDKVDESLRLALEALKKVRKDGDSEGEIAALRMSAKANLAKGDVWNAKRNIDDSLKLARQAGDKKAEAAAQHVLAKAHLAERKPEASKRVAQEAVDAFRSEGDEMGSSAALNTLAKVRLAQTEMKLAYDLVSESIKGFKSLGDDKGMEGQAYAMQTLLQVRLAQEKYQDALLIVEDLEEMYTTLDSHNGRGIAHLAAAEVCLSMGDLQTSLDKATSASEFFQAGGNKKKTGTALFVMANAFVTTAQWQEASKLADAAYRVFHDAHDKRGKADALSLMATGMVTLKQYANASAVMTEMAFLYRQLKDKQMEAISLQKLAKNQIKMIDTPGQMPADGWKQDDIEAPVRNAKRAVALYTELTATQSTAYAEALLTLSATLAFTGLYSEGLGRAVQAQKIYQALGVCEVDALMGIAKVHMAQNNSEQAQRVLSEAIDVASVSGTADQVDAARDLLEKSQKKKSKAADVAASLGRTSFSILVGDVLKAQFYAFEARNLSLPGGMASRSSSAPMGRIPQFTIPERHQVVYETRKQLVPTDSKTGMPL